MNRAPIKSLVRRLISNVVLIVIALLVGMQAFKALAAAATKPKRNPDGDAPLLVRMVEVKRQPWTQKIRGYGRARAMHPFTITSEIAGKVEYVHPALEVGNDVGPTLEPAPMHGETEAPKYPLGTVVVLDRADLQTAIDKIDKEIDALDSDVRRLEGLAKPLADRLLLLSEELDTAEAELARIEDLVRQKRLTPSELDGQRLQVLLRRRGKVDATWAVEENAENLLGVKERREARRKDRELEAHKMTIVSRIVDPGPKK